MVCPKCGEPIKRFDLSQNCHKCGANILYYTQEKDLSRDAKRSELEFAKARYVVGRIKTTYIGSAVAILRLIFGPLTVAALAIPFMKLTINLPLVSKDIATGAVGIYQMISSGIYTQLLNLFNVGVDGAVAVATLAHMVCLVLVVLMELAMFVTYLLASLNIRKSAKVLMIFTGLSALFDIGTIVTAFIAKADAAGSEALNVTIYPGGFVLLALLIVFFIADFLLYRMNPRQEIPEVDQKRIELLKEYKAGTLDLDSLPLPVFETEEEEEKRKNLFGEIAKAAGEGADD